MLIKSENISIILIKLLISFFILLLHFVFISQTILFISSFEGTDLKNGNLFFYFILLKIILNISEEIGLFIIMFKILLLSR